MFYPSRIIELGAHCFLFLRTCMRSIEFEHHRAVLALRWVTLLKVAKTAAGKVDFAIINAIGAMSSPPNSFRTHLKTIFPNTT